MQTGPRVPTRQTHFLVQKIKDRWISFFPLDFMRTAKGIPSVLDNNIGNSILKNPQRGELQGSCFVFNNTCLSLEQ